MSVKWYPEKIRVGPQGTPETYQFMEKIFHKENCLFWSRVMTKKEKLELDWLRYFYDHARFCMGPADSELYSMIKDDYVHQGNILPDQYKDEE